VASIENVATLPLDTSSTFIRVSNNPDVKQAYAGFTTHLGSMLETVAAFKGRGFKTVREVFDLSR